MAEVVVDKPNVVTAAEAPTKDDTIDTPLVAGADKNEVTATPIAPIATIQAALPVAFMRITLSFKLPSMIIMSALFSICFASSFSVLTVFITIVPFHQSELCPDVQL